MRIKERFEIIKSKKIKFITYLCVNLIVILSLTIFPILLWLNSGIMNIGVTSIIGSSMLPTFDSGKVLYIQETKFERGEIVVVDSPDNNSYNTSDLYLLKRIIGLPGETVLINEEGVLIDGKLLDESLYTDQQSQTLQDNNNFNEILLSDNEYFLLGDNRSDSFDSRHVGAIHSKDFLYGLTIEPNEHTMKIKNNFILIGVLNIGLILTMQIIVFILFSKRRNS